MTAADVGKNARAAVDGYVGKALLGASMAALMALMTWVATSVSDHSSKLSELGAKIDGVRGQVAELKATVETNRKEVWERFTKLADDQEQEDVETAILKQALASHEQEDRGRPQPVSAPNSTPRAH
ncbi:MAG: hypothetical protein JO255_02515 [Alphaproteobacteria bacterium]|nr:hypothetical protein [Alphaproteobacteria bacterium]